MVGYEALKIIQCHQFLLSLSDDLFLVFIRYLLNRSSSLQYILAAVCSCDVMFAPKILFSQEVTLSSAFAELFNKPIHLPLQSLILFCQHIQLFGHVFINFCVYACLQKLKAPLGIYSFLLRTQYAALVYMLLQVSKLVQESV